MAISTNNKKLANQILSDNTFRINNLKTFIPYHHYTRQAIIRHVPTEISMEDIVGKGASEGNVSILSARRFNRKILEVKNTKYVPSTTILINFDSKVIPKYVLIHYVRYPTEPFKPKPRQCYKCYKFGHVRKYCNSNKSYCTHCGNADHNIAIHCPAAKEGKSPCCLNCKDNHLPTDMQCLFKMKQYELFDFAFSNNISIDEARFIINNNKDFHNSTLSKSKQISKLNSSINVKNSFDNSSLNSSQPSYSQITQLSPINKISHSNIADTDKSLTNSSNKTHTQIFSAFTNPNSKIIVDNSNPALLALVDIASHINLIIQKLSQSSLSNNSITDISNQSSVNNSNILLSPFVLSNLED